MNILVPYSAAEASGINRGDNMKMKGHLIWLFIILISFYVTPADSQAPFSRGINLTGWFQVNSPGHIQFTRFTKKDFQNIKSLGCDVVRLPVNMHSFTSGEPLFTVDPLYFSFLDSAITWCEELSLYIILDNHSFDPNVSTSPDIGNILTSVWKQTSLRYKNRSDFLLYEILNEPHGITTQAWGEIQKQVINAIRANDSRHIIVVGGSGYNSYMELKNLPVYSDQKLLYTFHFYDPFVFTHQGASWVAPSMEPLSGVPFPYDAAGMPGIPASLRNTWIESNLLSYPVNGNVSSIKNLIDIAIEFRNSRGVNIFCGEFGVYIPNSDPDDRIYWYDAVCQYLEENNIPWTMWDYKGSFGLFNKGSDELFEHDLNIGLLQALGLNIPSQSPFSIKPDSTGFNIYSDFIGEKINDASYGSGRIDFYSSLSPANGEYSLSWTGISRYNALGFGFIPDKDLSRLVEEDYAMDFMVNGNIPGIKFDLRFTDSKTADPADLPWRMGIAIDDYTVNWNNKWHHVHIPLSALQESGSWHNNTWYDPQGKFDWKAVEKFEISTEYDILPGRTLSFDNIHVTNLDTAIVRNTDIVGVVKITEETISDLKMTPNPMKNSTEISFYHSGLNKIYIEIYSLTGQKIRTLTIGKQSSGNMSIIWNGCSDSGYPAPAGYYICRVITSDYQVTGNIIKY